MKAEVRRKEVEVRDNELRSQEGSVARSAAATAEGMKEKVKEPKTGAAIKLRRQSRSQMQFGNEEKVAAAAPSGGQSIEEKTPPMGSSAATTETDGGSCDLAQDGLRPPLQKGALPKRTKSEASREMWRKIHAGILPRPGSKSRPTRSVNPLFDLPEEQRAKLFAWLRECPYDDAVQQMLREQGWAKATSAQLNDFFEFEAEHHWEKRIMRAAQEANALVRLVEKSPARYSSGILAALGQEVFRQIASGQVQPEAMGKLATLFLKARSDERADQMQELKREKLRHELQGQIDQALEKLAEEVDRHPEAREAFEALRKELATSMAEAEGEI